jgi:hypothetical protein
MPEIAPFRWLTKYQDTLPARTHTAMITPAIATVAFENRRAPASCGVASETTDAGRLRDAPPDRGRRDFANSETPRNRGRPRWHRRERLTPMAGVHQGPAPKVRCAPRGGHVFLGHDRAGRRIRDFGGGLWPRTLLRLCGGCECQHTNERSDEEVLFVVGFRRSVVSLVHWFVHFTFTTSSGFQVLSKKASVGA